MSTFYRFVQGNTELVRVYSDNAFIIIKNDTTILTFNSIKTDEAGNYWLQVYIGLDHFIAGGVAQYQLFLDDQLKEWGTCQIIPNLALDPNQESRSRYRIIVLAIEAKLAGTATRAQRQVKVGDKLIQYMSANLLFGLLDYFKKKMAEEEGLVDPATNLLKIKYVWRIR